MVNSAETLVGASLGRESFLRTKLIEHRGMTGQQLRMERMIKPIHAVRRGSAGRPLAATRDESAIGERFEAPHDRQR